MTPRTVTQRLAAVAGGRRGRQSEIYSRVEKRRAQPNGHVLITDGPYLDTKELVGGITIVEAADLDAALVWAPKGAKVGRAPVEMREIFFVPAPAKE